MNDYGISIFRASRAIEAQGISKRSVLSLNTALTQFVRSEGAIDTLTVAEKAAFRQAIEEQKLDYSEKVRHALALLK